MDGKKIFLIVGALIVAIATALGVNTLMRGSATPQSRAAALPVDGPMVLVAVRALPVGTIVTPDAVRFQPWPKELMEQAYFLKDATDVQMLAGTVVRYPITAGQPLTQGALVKPGDRGFLAAALGPGMRAVTVKVTDESAVAGFVFPGDRIDLALTQTIQDSGGAPLYVTDTIVRNLRVLATDQRMTSKNADGKDEVVKFETVTLEATPRIAEKIAVAQAMGKLSLSLRPLAEDASELDRAIAAGEVSMPANGDRDAERRLIAAVAMRPTDANITTTTGGEVSRFARRSAAPLVAAPVASMANASVPAGAREQGTSGAAMISGPTVRVMRAGEMVVVPVGGK